MRGFFEALRDLRHRKIALHPYKCTGRSTALALKYISQAMLNPGLPVMVVDHAGPRSEDKRLLRTVGRCVSDLQLEGFSYNHTEIRVTFNFPPDLR